MKTKKQIADEAKELADALAGPAEVSLIQRTLRQLALMIHDLASITARESAQTVPRRKK
jgi:antitoxin component HigA of HigAB toxin-antitoxin module